MQTKEHGIQVRGKGEGSTSFLFQQKVKVGESVSLGAACPRFRVISPEQATEREACLVHQISGTFLAGEEDGFCLKRCLTCPYILGSGIISALL